MSVPDNWFKTDLKISELFAEKIAVRSRKQYQSEASVLSPPLCQQLRLLR